MGVSFVDISFWSLTSSLLGKAFEFVIVKYKGPNWELELGLGTVGHRLNYKHTESCGLVGIIWDGHMDSLGLNSDFPNFSKLRFGLN